MYKINKYNNYLLVEFQEDVYFDSLVTGIIETYQRSDYPHMNDIWVFGDLPVYLSHEDLNKIVQVEKKYYPSHAARNKTALVITSGFTKALAEMWKELVARMPFEAQIFETLEDAVKWIEAPAL